MAWNVSWKHMPSASMPTLSWNCLTAASVWAPKQPSISPQEKPRMDSAFCMVRTSLPLKLGRRR